MNNTLIVLIFFVTLVILDFVVKVYFAKKQQNANQNNTKDENEKLLTDFLSLISGICKECLDTLGKEQNKIREEIENTLFEFGFDNYEEVCNIIETFEDIIEYITNNIYIIIYTISHIHIININH